jgi:hypothetical protein
MQSAAIRKAIVGASIGNAVEWFGFTIYGFLATYLAANFFPTGNDTVALLAGACLRAHWVTSSTALPATLRPSSAAAASATSCHDVRSPICGSGAPASTSCSR